MEFNDSWVFPGICFLLTYTVRLGLSMFVILVPHWGLMTGKSYYWGHICAQGKPKIGCPPARSWTYASYSFLIGAAWISFCALFWAKAESEVQTLPFGLLSRGRGDPVLFSVKLHKQARAVVKWCSQWLHYKLLLSEDLGPVWVIILNLFWLRVGGLTQLGRCRMSVVMPD